MFIGAEYVSREAAEQRECHIYAQFIFSSGLTVLKTIGEVILRNKLKKQQTRLPRNDRVCVYFPKCRILHRILTYSLNLQKYF